jgi:hypothetical protein
MKASVHSVGSRTLPEAFETQTRDVSSKGIFLEFDEPPEVGTRLAVTIELPAEVIGKRVVLKCIARVMRIVREDGRLGVGSFIERYEFVPDERIKAAKA